MDEEEKGGKVIPFPRAAKPIVPESVQQTIVGHGNVGVIGNGNQVHVTVQPAAKTKRQPLAPVQPPVDHITGEQAAILRQLHAEWVELAATVKDAPFSGRKAWFDINRIGKSRTYTHMRQENFEVACAYIRKQMAILRSGKTAKKRDPKWRNSRISAIKARCINQLGNEFAYLPFIRRSFKAQSLTELDDEQLEKTYRHVLRLKPKF